MNPYKPSYPFNPYKSFNPFIPEVEKNPMPKSERGWTTYLRGQICRTTRIILENIDLRVKKIHSEVVDEDNLEVTVNFWDNTVATGYVESIGCLGELDKKQQLFLARMCADTVIMEMLYRQKQTPTKVR